MDGDPIELSLRIGFHNGPELSDGDSPPVNAAPVHEASVATSRAALNVHGNQLLGSVADQLQFVVAQPPPVRDSRRKPKVQVIQ